MKKNSPKTIISIIAMVILLVSDVVKPQPPEMSMDIAILEGVQAGNIVLDLRSYDLEGSIFHTVEGGEHHQDVFNNHFEFSTVDGGRVVRATVNISRDQIAQELRNQQHSPVIFLIQYTIFSQSGGTSTFVVNLRILDLDNNFPVFEGYTDRPFNVTYREGRVDTSVNRIPLAIDRDEGNNTVQRYVMSNDFNGLFGLEIRKDQNAEFITQVRLNQIGELDREHRSNYTLDIIAYEGTAFPRSATLKVIITIQDVCDVSPRFPVTRYFTSILENSPRLTVIPSNISAMDPDIVDIGMIEYSISMVCSHDLMINSPCISQTDHPFVLDRESGLLTLDGEVDREVAAEYEVSISAMDSCENMGTATVVVTIEDINDNPPVVKLRFNSTAAAESIGLGEIFYLRVSDKDDMGVNPPPQYTVTLHDNTTGVMMDTTVFALNIELDIVDVILTRSLDREVTDYYSLVLRATDLGTPSMSSLFHLPVYVLDVNDNSPIFNPVMDLYTFNENPNHNIVLATLQATDLDDVNTGNGRVSYLLPPNNSTFSHQDLFIVDSLGRLFANGTLDREQQEYLSVLVEARDNPASGTARSDFTVFNMRLTDVNDNDPIITSPPETLSIFESQSVGTVVFKVSATDLDSEIYANLTYSLVPPDNSPFSVNAISGNVTLGSPLDFESVTNYNLTVVASDGERDGTRMVIISVLDINDERCVFDIHGLYMTTVREELPENFNVVDIDASDQDTPDEMLSFSIVGGNELGNFNIHPSTGQITTTVSLDKETTSNYTLRVSCSDRSDMPTEIEVFLQVIDINDNLPQFVGLPYNFTVSENLPNRTTVGTVRATDADSPEHGMFRFRILYAIPNSTVTWFDISPTSGVITTTQGLNREAMELNGIANSKIGLNVEAYGITTDNSATEQFNTTFVYIQIADDNDMTPTFATDNVTITVEENFAINNDFPVRIHATDGDIHPHNVIRYIISTRSPQETPHFFTIDENTGYLRLVNTLDYETQNRYEFEVQAIDSDMQNRQDVQTVIVLIQNVAEMDIKFVNFVPHVNLMENAPLNRTLSEFTVTDNNGTPLLLNLATLAYTITENGVTPIDIGIRNKSVDGLLVVYVLGNIDRESQANGLERVFNITAWDTDTSERSHGSTSAIMRVNILDQNDNRPIFASPSYSFSVVENNDVALSIGTVAATDLDFGSNGIAGITYAIADTVPFEINDIGEVRNTERLDREENAAYNFNIIASDGGSEPMTSTVPVTISVRDINDNIPVFSESQSRTFRVREDERVNTTVAVLQVSDTDAGTFGEVSVFLGGIPVSKFRVDPDGSIVLVQNLDRELEPSYSFMVEARDGGGRSSTANVMIIVDDFNDNPPIFNPGSSTYFVQEDQMQNVEIASVTAHDADIGDNGLVRYDIETYSLRKIFCINQENGSIKLCPQDNSDSCSGRPVIDFERRNEYELSIVAYDNSTPTHLVYKTITINIGAVNEHAPTFESSFFQVYVDETRSIGVEVAKVKAIDGDKDDHINYEILEDSQQSVVFRYDQDLGAIVNNGILDVAQKSIYELTLVARDSGSRSGNTTVVVVVHNINDHRPIFESVNPPNQAIVISENTPVGTVVWTVKATDEDNNTHDAVSYFFDENSDNTPLHFSVDSLTGEISVNSTLDYELRDRYELRILARDTGFPQLTSTPLDIVISLKNENDEYPIFSSSNYQFSVYEKEPAGSVVDRVSAPDRDGGTFGEVKYSISGSGGTNDYFAINPDSGEITTRVVIDRDALEEAPGGSDVLYFQFSVLAADGASGSTAKTNVTSVRVRILDRNDNPPEFSASQYLIRVSPDQLSPITTAISVTDRDESSNSLYQFSLPIPSGMFQLEISPTGQLSFEGPLPAILPSYTYTISVIDDNDDTLFDTARLELIIESDMDHSPQFNPVSSPVSVRELEEINYIVFQVSDVVTDPDPDSGPNGQLSYQLAGDSDLHFAIDESSGTISLRQMLDYETSRSHNLTVVVLDGTPDTRRRATGTVTVTVLPDNEYTPEFYDIPSQLILSYHPQIGLNIFSVTARDMDQGTDGDINYSISDLGDFFKIDRESGVIRNQGILDTDMALDVTICAYDLGNSLRMANTTMSITVRDAGVMSTPIFLGNNPRTISEPEDISENSFINTNTPFSTSQAAQSFHVVSQKRLGETAQIDMFSVSATTGILRVHGTFDYETTTMFTIIIESRIETAAMSGSIIQRASDFLTVLLMVTDVNDNLPVFSTIEEQRFDESISVGTRLFSVQASDQDSGLEGAVSYDIIQGDSEGTFRINSSTGEVFLHQPLNREAVSEYDLEIRAQDLSNQPLTSSITVHVDIMDVNDFVTTYGGRNFSIDVYEYPSTEAGDRIVKLSALDEDEGPPLRYTIELLEVRHVRNSLAISDYRGRFILDGDSGLISVGSQVLDRETVDYFLFRVIATDRVHFVDTYLTIRILDVNDHPPVVIPVVPIVRIPVWEDQPAGLFVTDQISVSDEDTGINSWVKYSLGDDWPDNYFKIDPLSGVIRTNDVINATSDVVTAITNNLGFTGTVIIEDQGFIPNRVTTSVYLKIVDVNNNPPVFDSDSIHLSVSVGAMPGTSVHQFIVTDRDFALNAVPIMYTIPHFYTEVTDNFIIEAATGLMTVDRVQEVARSYNFLLQATNPSYNPECVEFMQASSINVTISVRPFNTDCPEFLQPTYITEIAEETTTSDVLIDVRASDPNGDGVTYSIINETALPFSIHLVSGALTLLGTLDRETKDTYSISVLATDDGFPPLSCSIEVIVNVLDINDHSPIFDTSEYTGLIEENAPANTYVLTLHATDIDLGQAGTVIYQLVHDDFRVDETTGEIFTRQSLDYEATPSYTVTASARDNGSSPERLLSMVTVAITVADIDEGGPSITARPSAPIQVDQGKIDGNVIYTVIATDPDTRVQLFYFFNTPTCYLSIDNRTGNITLQLSSDKSCPNTLIQSPDPQYFTMETSVSVSDGINLDSVSLKFNFHVSFIETPPEISFLSIEIIAASITAALVLILVIMCICVFACICRYNRNHSKIRINDTTPEAIELRKRFGSGRSGNSVQAPIYKQTSLHSEHHTTMTIPHSNGSGASSVRQSYTCGGDIETDQHEKNSYPSPSAISRKSQLSRPYRSTSDLGSSTMATDISYSQETAPYPKSQIERIYAKNADLLNQSDSNESIHMFGSEGGGESDGGDDMLFRKFNDLDDDDDSTTMPEDEDDRSYHGRSIPSSRENINVHAPPVDILEDPYPFDHPAMNWAPRVSNMADTIDQIAIHNYKPEEPMRHGGGQQRYAEEFSKSQTGSVYGGGQMSQESAGPLLRHTPPSHHHQSRLPPQAQHHMMDPPNYYGYEDSDMQEMMHEQLVTRTPVYGSSAGPARSQMYGSSTGIPNYSNRDIPRGHQMDRRGGGGGGGGGGASQEVPAYDYHGNFMHHSVHHDHSSPSSSTPTDGTLTTRALTNEYESDMMYSSDTSINTNTEMDHSAPPPPPPPQHMRYAPPSHSQHGHQYH